MNKSDVVLRLAAIGAILLGTAASFAYAGGWLAPGRLTPPKFVDAFEQANGHFSGFRRNHAKGVCVAGSFESNGQGATLSKAAVFKPGKVPVIGRFALASANPHAPDTPGNVRSLALSFTLPNGELWRTGINDIPVFPFKTPEAFFEQLVAARPDPATGKPDPEKMKAFAARHPETARAIASIRAEPRASGFEDATYNSLNAFRLVGQDGKATPVRWAMVPAQPFKPADAANADTQDKNYQFDALIALIQHQPLQWRLVITVGQPGDPTDDATIAWPSERTRIDVGTLTIDRIAAEGAGGCRDIVFDPLILPSGIEASDDPLLSARSSVYSRSFTRRAGEAKEPSDVKTPSQPTGGGS